MNAGQRFGALVEAFLDQDQDRMGRTLANMSDNELISTLLAGVGMFLGQADEIEEMGGSQVGQVILALRDAPAPPFEPDWSLLREMYRQPAARGPSAGQDEAGGGREG